MASKKKPNGTYASKAAASQAARREGDSRAYLVFSIRLGPRRLGDLEGPIGWGYAFEGSVGAIEVLQGVWDKTIRVLWASDWISSK